MGSSTLTRYPCVILADGHPGNQCRAADTVTEAMLSTSSLRIRYCETYLDAYGYDYTDATITGPANGVYYPGKLIMIVTPHTTRIGRVKSWTPIHRITNQNGQPKYSVEFKMVIKFITEE